MFTVVFVKSVNSKQKAFSFQIGAVFTVLQHIDSQMVIKSKLNYGE
ncbi:hypothetical protein HMPREF0971_00477 [Segatella oris F0302]|uniref:Uncharacterized protein n=1 Tax=Segatella oris F0302 TaxID=649760 RepID=D1QNE1_9BACT|nr:hypothetical protein HMPREF0971_00477 [Segatella oris F0302]